MDVDARIARHLLGLSREALADVLDVAPRTVRRWEAATQDVPPWAHQRLAVLLADAESQVAGVLEMAGNGVSIVVERVGPIAVDAADGYRRTRMLAIVARAVDRRPDLALTWVEATPA